MNLTRFQGVFAPNSQHRIKITPAKRGKGRQRRSDEQGQSSFIACIEDPVVIDKILSPLDTKAASTDPVVVPQPRAPPQASLFD